MSYTRVKILPTKIEEVIGNNYLITSNHVNDSTHTYHKYPAKFIPHIPRWGINIAPRKAIILDPFCGSGTTNLEAYRAGHLSVGIDIDPLALLIAKVKTTPINPKSLREYQRDVLTEYKRFNPKISYYYPPIDNIDHWFSLSSKKKLGFLRNYILNIKSKDIREFFLITFSSILRESSNADNQSQKTYVSHTFKKTPPEVFELFEKRMDNYIEKMDSLFQETKNIPRENRPVFIKGDSRKDIINNLKNYPKTLPRMVITSPPYIKAIDYMYNQMLEYFWIGDLLGIEGKEKINEYKKKYIGTQQIQASEYNKFNDTKLGISELDEVINKIKKHNLKHSYITYSYFKSMEENLKQIYEILRKNELYVMVVGNTSVSGEDIPTDYFLAMIAKNLGYEILGKFLYKIRNRYMRFDRKGRGGFVDDDIVLVLKK